MKVSEYDGLTSLNATDVFYVERPGSPPGNNTTFENLVGSIVLPQSRVTGLVSDLAGKQATGNYITALTGDVVASGPGSVAATLATVNSAPGTVGGVSKSLTAAVNAKGLVTAISEQAIEIAESQVIDLVSDLAGKQTALGYTAENVANKNQAGGYAGLDSGGKINPSQLAALAISDTFVVASEVAMLALTAQTGDVAVRTDLSKSFILAANDPAQLANWQELLTPVSPVTSLFGRTGVVTAQSNDYSFSQIAGQVTNAQLAGAITAAKLVQTDIELAESQITNLTSDLAAKANAGLSNLASVAINTDLLPVSTQGLGSALFPFLASFIGNTTQYESVSQSAGLINHEALGSATNINIALMPKGMGNVGIGTTSPQGKLDIRGNAYMKDEIVFDTDPTELPVTIFGDFVPSQGNDPMLVMGYNVKKDGLGATKIQSDKAQLLMRLEGNANAGNLNLMEWNVDYTSADNLSYRRLILSQVDKGTGHSTTTMQANRFNFIDESANGLSGATIFQVDGSTHTVHSYVPFYSNELDVKPATDGGDAIRIDDGAGNNNVGYLKWSIGGSDQAAIRGYYDGTLTQTLAFYTGNSSIRRLTIDGYGAVGIGIDPTGAPQTWKFGVTGTSYFNGNVGIGTTSPAARLEVKTSGENAPVLSFVHTDGTPVAEVRTGGLLLNNTFFGAASGQSVTTAQQNAAFGYWNLLSLTTGSYNSAFGTRAVEQLTTGENNTGVGHAALTSNISGDLNTAIGSYNSALLTGTANTAIGARAFDHATAASYNVAVGYLALTTSVTGAYNTAVGQGALSASLSDGGTAVGRFAGASVTSGANNTLLGFQSDVTSGALTNDTAIGYNAKVGASNALVLGGTDADAINVGIGTTTPGAALDVNGEIFVGNGGVKFAAGGGGSIGRDGGTGDLLLTPQSTHNIILTAGNVGIGTTTPLKTLDVAGGGRFTGKASSALTGTADPTASTTLIGTGTLFSTELVIGDRITVNAETRTVTAIASDTSLTVDSAFTDTASAAITRLLAIFITRLSSNAVGMVQNDLGNVGIGTTTPSGLLSLATAGVFGWGTASLDTAFSRIDAGLVGVGTRAAGSFAGSLKLTDLMAVGRIINGTFTVSTLPTGAAGATLYVTDGDSGLVWGATITNSGSGATPYLVWYNGSAWTVVGK